MALGAAGPGWRQYCRHGGTVTMVTSAVCAWEDGIWPNKLRAHTGGGMGGLMALQKILSVYLLLIDSVSLSAGIPVQQSLAMCTVA